MSEALATRPPASCRAVSSTGCSAVTVLALSVDERELLLGVLEEAERPSLAELRRVLARIPAAQANLKQISTNRAQPRRYE